MAKKNNILDQLGQDEINLIMAIGPSKMTPDELKVYKAVKMRDWLIRKGKLDPAKLAADTTPIIRVSKPSPPAAPTVEPAEEQDDDDKPRRRYKAQNAENTLRPYMKIPATIDTANLVGRTLHFRHHRCIHIGHISETDGQLVIQVLGKDETKTTIQPNVAYACWTYGQVFNGPEAYVEPTGDDLASLRKKDEATVELAA